MVESDLLERLRAAKAAAQPAQQTDPASSAQTTPPAQGSLIERLRAAKAAAQSTVDPPSGLAAEDKSGITLPPWLEGDTKPVSVLSSQDKMMMQRTADSINSSRERREKVAGYMDQLQDSGINRRTLASLGVIESFQVDPAAVIEAAGRDTTLGKIAGFARAFVSALPGVPNPDVSEDARLKAEAIQMVAALQGEKSFGDAMARGVGNVVGTMGSLHAGGALAGGVAKAYRGLRGLKAAEEASKLAKLGKSAAGFGAYMAMPTAESAIYDDYTPGERIKVAGQAVKEFGKGAALGAALGGATKLGESIPHLSPWIGRPLAQTAVTSGARALETGELPTGREAKLDLVLNAMTQGLPSRMLPEFLKGGEARSEPPLLSKLVPVTDEIRARYPKTAEGKYDPTVGSIVSGEKAEPAVATVSAPPESNRAPDINPSYKAMLDGKRPVYMDPNKTALTPLEAKTRSTPMEPGVEVIRTDEGSYHLKPESFRAWLEKTKRFNKSMIARNGEEIDIPATIRNFEKADRIGQLLDYGLGNHSKSGGKVVVTGYDSKGNEIETIIAQNQRGAEDALRRHGSTEIKVRPLEKITEVIAPRIDEVKKLAASDEIDYATKEQAAKFEAELRSKLAPEAAKSQENLEEAARRNAVLEKQYPGMEKDPAGGWRIRRDLGIPQAKAEVAPEPAVADTPSGITDLAREPSPRADRVFENVEQNRATEPPKPVVKPVEMAVPESKPIDETNPLKSAATEIANAYEAKLGKYVATNRGVMSGGATGKAIGGSYTEINNRKAAKSADRFRALAEKADKGTLNPSERMLIESTAKRLKIKGSSREGGFIDLSFLTGKKKPQTVTERHAELDKEVETTAKNKWYPQYDEQADGAPDVYDAGVKAFADTHSKIYKASEFTEGIWHALEGDPKMVDLWMRYVVHQNAAELRKDGRNPDANLFMPHDEWLLVRHNRKLFDKAYEVTKEFSDSVEKYATDAGIGSKRRTPEDVPYMRLARLTTDQQLSNTTQRAKRAKLPVDYLEAQDANETANPATGGQGIGSVMRHMSRKSGSSKKATGQSKYYAVEPFTMAMEMLSAHQTPAHHKRFIESIKRHAITEAQAKERGFKTQFRGREVDLVKVPIEKRPDWLPEQVSEEPATEGPNAKADVEPEAFVPKPIHDMWMDYLRATPAPEQGKLGKIISFPVRYSLASTFGDSAGYVMGTIDSTSRIPGYGRTAFEQAALKFGGIVKFLGAIRDVEDQTSPEWKKMRDLLVESGSIRVSEEGPQSPSNSIAEPEYWLPKPAHAMTTAVFGRGGKAERQRISIGLALRKADPTLTDAQIVHTVQNMGGAFVKALQPGIVQAVRGGPLRESVAPFINWGSTKLRNSLDQFRGKKPTAHVNKMSGESGYSPWQALKIPYTAGTAVLLAYILGDDESIRETLSHPGSFRWNGRDYPFAKFLAPFSSAALRFTGIENAVSSLARGDTQGQTVKNVLRAPLNYAGGYLGPVPASIIALLSGKVPHIGPDGDPIPATPPSEYPIRDMFTGAAGRLLPGFEDQILATSRSEPMSGSRRLLETVLGSVGIESKAAYPLEQAHNTASRYDDKLYSQTISGIASAAMKIKDRKTQIEFIKSEAKKRLLPEHQANAVGVILNRIGGKQEYIKEGAAAYDAENR